jgi:serine/threonine protein kinase
LTPSNILVKKLDDGSWIAKLNDFGSAKRLSEATENVSYVTARFYRAPELLVGSLSYCKFLFFFFFGLEKMFRFFSPFFLFEIFSLANAVDVWSMGTILFSMVFGKDLIRGNDDIAQLDRLVELTGTQARIFQRFHFPHLEPLRWELLVPISIRQVGDLLSKMLIPDPNIRISIKVSLLNSVFCVLTSFFFSFE